MNDQEKMNIVRQLLTAFFAMITALVPSLATSAQFTILQASLLAAIPALCTLGSIIWSAYAHWNMKKVPDQATAVILPGGPEPKGTTINLTPMTGLAKVVGALLIGFILLQAMPAFAAVVAKPAPAPSVDPLTALMNQIENIQSTSIANVVAALQEADKDAATIIVPAIAAAPASADGSVPATAAQPAQVKDPIAHACYPAQIQYLQSLPTAKPIQSPPPYNLIVLFQYKRDFVNLLLSGQLVPPYLKLGCSAMLGQEALIFGATLGLIGIAPAIIAPITAFGSGLGAAALSIPAIGVLAVPK